MPLAIRPFDEGEEKCAEKCKLWYIVSKLFVSLYVICGYP